MAGLFTVLTSLVIKAFTSIKYFTTNQISFKRNCKSKTKRNK